MIFKELFLFARDLNAQKVFYSRNLGFELVDEGSVGFSIQAGNTIVHFSHHMHFSPYHFAFNVTPHSILQVHHWLADRVTIEPMHGKEIIVFDDWNARSCFFYDADGNIVEFIDRQNLQAPVIESEPFYSILGLSEIGVASNEPHKVLGILQDVAGLRIYDQDGNRFYAIGDEHGLFILVNSELKNWIPNNDVAYPSPFKVKDDQGRLIEFDGIEIKMASL